MLEEDGGTGGIGGVSSVGGEGDCEAGVQERRERGNSLPPPRP
jgi:hypothetical protein